MQASFDRVPPRREWGVKQGKESLLVDLPGRRRELPGIKGKDSKALSPEILHERRELMRERVFRQHESIIMQKEESKKYLEKIRSVKAREITALPEHVVAAREAIARERKANREKSLGKITSLRKIASSVSMRSQNVSPAVISRLSPEVEAAREAKAQQLELERRRRAEEGEQHRLALMQRLSSVGNGKAKKALDAEVERAWQQRSQSMKQERLTQQRARAESWDSFKMRLDEAAPRNSTKLPETVEEQRRLLRERTLATKAEALKNQRREAAELRKVLSSVRPAESTGLSEEILEARRRRAQEIASAVEAEADRLAMENEVMEERLKGATATDTYQISKEMQSLLDLQTARADEKRKRREDDSKKSYAELQRAVQRAAPATETKLSNDLQTFAALLNKDLEEARRQRAAKMEEENSKMRERLSKVDGKLLPELRKARKERAEREREEAKKEVEAKKDALSSLKEELIDVQSKRAWAEGDADDAGHAEKELEIMKSIRRMTSERSKSQWKVGITAAIARAAEAIPDANGGSEGTVPGGENTASAVNGDSSSMLAEKEMKPMPSLLLRMFSKK